VPFSEVTEYFQALFCLSERLMNGAGLQRRFVGALLLNCDGKPLSKAAREAFNRWKFQTGLAQVILSSDCHSQLLYSFSRILDQVLTFDSLEPLLNRLEGLPSTKRPKPHRIVKRVFVKVDQQVGAELLLRIVGQEHMSSESICFVANSLESVASLDADRTKRIVAALINHGCHGIAADRVVAQSDDYVQAF
jgi:hypothetical protein